MTTHSSQYDFDNNHQQNYSLSKEASEYFNAIGYIEKDMYHLIEKVIRRLRNSSSSYNSRAMINLRKSMFDLIHNFEKGFDSALKEMIDSLNVQSEETWVQGTLFDV